MSVSIQIINKDKNVLKIDWTDSENLKKWLARQRTRSGWFKNLSDQIFFGEYQEYIQKYWSIIEKMNAFELSENSKILDIGSGVGLIDLFLALQFKNANFILLDKNSDSPIKENRYGDLHPFYNSWGPTVDAIQTTKLNSNRFIFVTPEDNFIGELDLVMSHFSWCWHYDVSTYIDKAYSKLKHNGFLLLTVRFTDTEDIMEILNKKFGTCVNFHPFKKEHQIETEKNIFNVSGPYYGGIGLWQKTI